MQPDVLVVFREVADRPSSEREAYYASHRVADAVRVEVESLLRFDSQTDDGIGADVASAASRLLTEGDPEQLRRLASRISPELVRARSLVPESGAPGPDLPADAPGSWFGPYRLRRPLGAGGMGVVWLADQEQPIRRTVALKVVRREADSARVLSRFESERQTLAILNHPHIASVFDAGATPDGRPFFVMEHVAGDPITRFADDRRLTIPERLELFLQVCDAVQHAHQKGILHRDLKPGNILVADLDGHAVAKVIDFGVAKAVSEQVKPEALLTEIGVLVGTPEYMSPEQAGFLGGHVDTRTDIFSLGLVLYELLAGTPPFDRPSSGPNAALEMLRVIREEDAPRLTRRLASQPEAAAREIAHRRQIDPRSLRSELHGDLEWITARAIDHDPNRRYPSASELAADIRRHLDIEPVTAGPPGLRYRLGKLSRKHRATAIAAALAMAIVIVASLASTFFGIQSARAQREARRQLVSLDVAEGMRLVDQNDHLRALPWLVQALKNEPDGAPAEEAHRRRIAMILDRTPALAAVVTFDVALTEAEISPDRTWIAVAMTDGGVRVVNLENGAVSTGREKHGGKITSLAISGDGRRVVTGGTDGLARVWNASLEPAGPALRHGAQVGAVAISPDGARIATAGKDAAVRVWEAAGGTVRSTLAHDGPVVAVAFSPDGVRIATASGSVVRLWDAATGQRIGEGFQHSRDVGVLAFSPDGTRLAVAAVHTLRIWNMVDGQPLGNEIAQTNPIYQLAFSPDSRWVAWGSSGNVLGVIDARTGSLAMPMQRRQDQVFSVAFSPDGLLLASLEAGGHIQLWRTVSWQPDPIVVRGGARARVIFFDRSGRRVVSSGEAETLIWDLAAAVPARPPMPHATAVRELSFSPDGSTLMTTAAVPLSRENFTRVWSTETSEPLTPPLRAPGALGAAFDPQGARVATGGLDGRIRIWDARTGEQLGPPLVQGAFIARLAFSPDGRFLASAGSAGVTQRGDERPGDIYLWDVAAGKARWSGHTTRAVSALAFSPDGRRLEIGTRAGEVSFHDAATGARLPGGVQHGSDVHTIVVAPDGRWSATASEQATYIWDHTRGEGLRLRSVASAASFDSRNTALAIGTLDGAVSVLNPATGQPFGWHMKPGGLIYSVRFDRTDRFLVTASMDGSARVWDARGRPVSPRLRHEGPVWSASFSPSNGSFASGGGGTARVWEFGQETASLEELASLAEVLSGYRFDASMAPVPLEQDELRRAFDKLRRERPSRFAVTPEKEAQWERTAAEWAIRTGRVQDAIRHFDRVTELEPARAAAWAERGDARAQLGLWAGAIADFEKAIELRPDAAEHVRDLAYARLGGGDEPGHRGACARMQQRFGSTSNPDRAQWIARACVLLPPASREDTAWLVRAAERAQEIGPAEVRQLETLGAAKLRAGDEAAAATLQRAVTAAPQGRDTWSFLFLAIAGGKRQKPCDRSIVDRRAAADQPGLSWRDRIELDTLLRQVCITD